MPPFWGCSEGQIVVLADDQVKQFLIAAGSSDLQPVFHYIVVHTHNRLLYCTMIGSDLVFAADGQQQAWLILLL